jgi:hypothetical protein
MGLFVCGETPECSVLWYSCTAGLPLDISRQRRRGFFSLSAWTIVAVLLSRCVLQYMYKLQYNLLNLNKNGLRPFQLRPLKVVAGTQCPHCAARKRPWLRRRRGGQINRVTLSDH